MKLRALIKSLEDIQSDYGDDLDVYYRNKASGSCGLVIDAYVTHAVNPVDPEVGLVLGQRYVSIYIER